MYFYKSNDGVLVQSPLSISRYIEITEEEYIALEKQNMEAAKAQELEDKKALLQQLKDELGGE